MVTPRSEIVNNPYCKAVAIDGHPWESASMPVLPLADATSAADIPGVRLLGLVVGALFLLIAIRAMFRR